VKKKPMRRQSIGDRIVRALQGRCPVHGVYMRPAHKTHRVTTMSVAVACPVTRCGIRGKSARGLNDMPRGTVRLLKRDMARLGLL
jgi:hypothetical protein